jgi:arylsulfatase A-like enzyme
MRLLIGCLTLLTGATAVAAAERPNIVVILADDLGWTDLGCQGSGYYETPHIDRMAAGGVRFTNGYSCGPNCQPTRAALMSGQYGPRTGVYTVGNINRFDWRSRPLKPVDSINKLNPAVVTLGESLKAAGYTTGYFGKWHLGDDPQHHPSAQGFNEAIVSSGKHFDFKTNPETESPEGTYLADFLTDQSIDFLKAHKEGPFYLQLSHFGVHAPYQAKPELIARFKDKPPIGGHHDPVYAAMIASVDESVGRVLDTLDELGLAENTLVVFTSDNGGVGGYKREGLKKKRGDTTDNAPLRGGKGMLYEGGIRVPYLFHWKGTIDGGRTTDRPINSVDLYPTLLEIAGAGKPDQPLDGESYLAVLEGDDSPRDPLYWHFPGYLGQGKDQWRTLPVGAIRDGDWKLMEFFEDGRLELYDLQNDPGEKTNLAEEHPDRAKAMQQQLAAWRKSVGAKLPTRQ